MKKNFLLLLLGLLVFTGCSKDDDTPPVVEETPPLTREDFEVQDYMYLAMNEVYLYQPDVPVLRDNYFTSESKYVEFLSQNSDPEMFFYDELVAEGDRFSFVTDDYVALENQFAGTTKTDGLDLGFNLYNSGNSVYAFALIRYVAPGSPAAEKGLKRGQIILRINGEPLTVSDNRLSDRAAELLSLDNYTLTVSPGIDSNNQISSNTTDYDLNKVEFTENPILIAKTLNVEGQKIGYLMYNSFVRNFDDELNDAFAQFKADGVTDLVLDLRYNGGGSVDTAIDLCSMITGQFDGQVLIKQKWNPRYQTYLEAEAPERLINRFNSTIFTGTNDQAPINSLNLNRLYVIGTGSTASASELTVVGLEPYIQVTSIGTTTRGKFQASATLYDSSNFGRQNANPDHTYAIQPLIYEYSNANDVIGPASGLTPDIQKTEEIANMGVLGETNEPLLAAALEAITGKSFVSKMNQKNPLVLKSIGESGMFSPTYQKMYDNNIPVIKK